MLRADCRNGHTVNKGFEKNCYSIIAFDYYFYLFCYKLEAQYTAVGERERERERGYTDCGGRMFAA
jgi:hypothetical protein